MQQLTNTAFMMPKGPLARKQDYPELFLIVSSIWQHRFQYLFGFLMLVIAILMVTFAELLIALIYSQLTKEGYKWWRQSFLACAALALYLFLYNACDTVEFLSLAMVDTHVARNFKELSDLLTLATAILVITCAGISIVLTYIQLTNERYNRGWQTLLASAGVSSALYLLLYSFLYQYTGKYAETPIVLTYFQLTEAGISA